MRNRGGAIAACYKSQLWVAVLCRWEQRDNQPWGFRKTQACVGTTLHGFFFPDLSVLRRLIRKSDPVLYGQGFGLFQLPPSCEVTPPPPETFLCDI